jgi:hypothetical protein
MTAIGALFALLDWTTSIIRYCVSDGWFWRARQAAYGTTKHYSRSTAHDTTAFPA